MLVKCLPKSMASPPPQTPPRTYQRAVEAQKEVPYELTEIVARSLQIGASAGMCTVTKTQHQPQCTQLTGMGNGIGACGVVFGATAGIVRGTTPVLFSIASGIQWFGLGSVYYGKPSMSPRGSESGGAGTMLTCEQRHEEHGAGKAWA